MQGGSAPTFGHLRVHVAAALNLPADKCRICKFFAPQREWVELRAHMRTGGQPGRSKANSGPDNILAAPYSLKDGDLLCGFDRDDYTGDIVRVSRYEDIVERRNRTRTTEQKRLTSKARKTKTVRHEVSLSLGHCASFSDDEDEEETT